MQYSITSKPAIFRGGINVAVKLDFTPDEHQVIQAHCMVDTLIVEPQDWPHLPEPIFFKDFYGRTSTWHVTSSVEAQAFIKHLEKGLRFFQKLLLANAVVPEEVYEDFSLQLFDLSLIPPRMWFEHTYVLGESGGGKTQLIQTLLLLHRQQHSPPGFVIVDSQNKMLPLIKEKFPSAIHIDPEHNPPHIDLFSLPLSGNGRAGMFRLMDTFRYLFEAGGEPITGRQRTIFERGVALMYFGYPAAFGRSPTIDDFEDFFQGAREKRTRVLSKNAWKAVASLPSVEREWYASEYQHFDEACTQILQRLSNIMGPYSALRPMLSQGEKFDFAATLDTGGIVLVNTNADYLQGASSAFLGRFFIKMLEQHMNSRGEDSHPLFLVVDEVQEYFDSALMSRFPDQARKRNVACVFAHQRLAQIRKHPELYDALTGVAIRFGTNLNDHDIRDATQIWHAPDAEFMSAQRRVVDENGRFAGAQYALYLRGQDAPASVCVEFFQLERLQTPKVRDLVDYDLHWTKTLHPKVARDGGTFVFQESDEIPPIRIRAGTRDGEVYRLHGYGSHKPDGTRGDLYVMFHVPDFPRRKADTGQEPRGEPRRIIPRKTEDMDTGSASWP